MDILGVPGAGSKWITFEMSEHKVQLARQTIKQAEVGSVVEIVQGDALEHLPRFQKIGFCFLDAEKDLYEKCYDSVVPRMVAGGLLIADNVISHQSTHRPFMDRAMRDD